MDKLSDSQINIILGKAEIEMESIGSLTWTTSKLLIRAIKQLKDG